MAREKRTYLAVSTYITRERELFSVPITFHFSEVSGRKSKKTKYKTIHKTVVALGDA